MILAHAGKLFGGPPVLGPIVGRHDWTYLISVRPNFTGPVKPRDVDARDDFRYDTPAFASAHAHRGDPRHRARCNGGALWYRSVLRNDRRRDRRLLVNAYGSQREPAC